MRRILLLLGVAAFLVAVLAWPLTGVSSRSVWPLASGLILFSAAVVLRETRGAEGLSFALLVSLGFGLVFPVLAVNLSSVYAFTPAAGYRVAGVPVGTFVVWTSFLLLALALSDQLRWLVASARGWRPGPWTAGLVLAAMECLWDPALLAEGLLVSKAKGYVAWPLGFTPGFPAFHLMAGWFFAYLVDRAAATGRHGARRAFLSVILLCVTGLLFVVPSGFHAPPPSDLPLWLRASLDMAIAFGSALGQLLAGVWVARAWISREGAPVLFTSVTAPVRPYPGGVYPLDFYSSRFTRGQGVWSNEAEVPYLGNHMLARNLNVDSVVLEYPTLGELEAELRETAPGVVGIGFTLVSRDRVLEMCRLVKRIRPEALLVLGGYGVVCLPEEGKDELSELADEVCHGEGVAFMRKLLGDEPDRPVELELPPQELYPLGIRPLARRMAPLVVGFGCDRRCGFCGTSAFFGGENLRLASAERLAARVKQALRQDSLLIAFPIFDEDYLQDKERVVGVAEILRADPEVELGRVSFSCFATIESMQQYTPAELQALGIGFVWTGVESVNTPLKKCAHEDTRAYLDELAEHGICVTLSWVLGFDFQTPENLVRDLDWYVSLPAVTAQVSLLGPIPGTALHRQMEARDRLIEQDWERQHLYEECMEYEHFAPGELRPWVDRAYDELYRRKGPSILRMAETWLRGWRTLSRLDDLHLEPRVRALGAELRELGAVIAALGHVGEEEHHRIRARAWLEGMEVAGPGLPFYTRPGGWVLSLYLAAAAWLQERWGLPARQPRVRRSFYRGGVPGR